MAKAGYTVATSAAVALSAATAKSIIGVRAGSAFGVDLKKYRIAFDGTTSTATPVLIEVCYATFATNAPGTNSTTRTPAQVYGRTIAHGTTAASNWTTEPTVLTVIEEHLLTPFGGLEEYDFPFPETPDSAVSEGFVIRCNAPATVNVRATLWWERC